MHIFLQKSPCNHLMAITGTLIVFIKLITYKFCSSESYLLAIAACDVSHSKTLPCLALTVGILCIRIHAVIIQRISVYQKFLSHFYLCLCCVYIHRISGYVKYAVIAVIYSFVCIRGRLVCEQYTLPIQLGSREACEHITVYTEAYLVPV